MATQLEDVQQDEELDTMDIDLDEADEEQDDAQAEGAEDEDSGEAEDDGDVVSFGGVDLRDEDEPEHISDLRRRYREEKKRREELEHQLAPRVEDIGAEPNMDDYWERDDPQGEFKRDLLTWNAKRQAAEQSRAKQLEQQQTIQREYEADVEAMQSQRAALKVRDFDAAEERVSAALDPAQQAILTQVAKNKAALWYALGKNPDRLATLAKVTNYAKFAGEVARLDMETRVARKPTTQPDGTVRGSGGTLNGKAAGDAKLARLEAEAAKTGDRSAIAKYRRELRLAGRA
jgi:hypothetical protein